MIFLTVQLLLLVIYTQAYENLAFRKPAWQAHSWPDKGYDVAWGASKAVDGQYSDRSAPGNQCTISEGKTTATLRVDLGRMSSINHINIYYRTDNAPSPGAYFNRFAGFFLYVSNDTFQENGKLCFHEIQTVNGTPSENKTINCLVHGRYVIYYNERKRSVTYPTYYSKKAFNEVCELQVFGCNDPRKYGVNCDQVCSEKCKERRCYTTGDCLGCIPGYKGSQCNRPCDKQRYGLGCSLSCGNCSNGETCHHINGTCLKGCNEGAKGETCQMPCNPGYYGKDCVQQCNVNCGMPKRCDRFTGECEGGCQAGWRGTLCDKPCDGRMYGNNCNQTCGHCLNNTQCYHINGECLDGCSAGYEGQLCINKCNEVNWGIKCKMNCSTECVNQTCHHVSGDCYRFKQPMKTPLDSFSSLPVIVGVVVFIVVLVICVISATLLRRACALEKGNRGQIKKKNERDRDTTPTAIKDFNNFVEDMEGNSQSAQKTSNVEGDDDIDNDEKMHEENPYGDLYVNDRRIPDINVEELECTIEDKRKNEDDGFKREYADMPYGERYPCNAGKQPDNIPKNRYKTTFPYDHSRIKILNSQSNYINANFIDGIDKINAYIAAQGPLQNTVTDFWTMIWQENVNQIVMVTNLKEGNKIKCFKYWPDLHQSSTFDVISLRAEEEKIYAYYNIRKFRVTNQVQKKYRMVTQYHYTAWPDHGTPDPLCLVVFHDHVKRSKETQNGGPTLVHCSAGIGRTGTYIAIDSLYKAGKTNRKINIAEYVKKMRENRMNMVQTYEQYMTIFLALDSMFKAPICLYTKPEFLRRAELMIRDKPANESVLRKEFQNLLKVRLSYTEVDYKVALQSGYSKSSVLPLDKYSVFLSSSVPKRGNYINAVTLPSYTNPNAFIVTHYPSSEDAVDFLRLLTDHESDLLICMDPLNDIKSIKTWLPVTNNSKTVFPFTVQCGHQQITDIKCTTINITQIGANQGSSVSIVEPTGSFNNSQSSQASEQMLRLVTFALQSDTEGPITIVSSDGAGQCGVFCSVYNVLQQLSVDGEVDIFSTVRQLHIRRPEICSSMDEYRMIYDVLLDYIRGKEDSSEENVYYNQ